MPKDARYYLNHYRPQIEEAIRKSYSECIEYGYIEPISRSPCMIAGKIASLIIPEALDVDANMLFHTHPLYSCGNDTLTHDFQRYITEHFSVFFSSTDIRLLFQHRILVGLVAGYTLDHKVVIRNANRVSSIIANNYAYRQHEIINLISKYAAGLIPENDPLLQQTTVSFQHYIDRYTPIIEIMDLNLP
ncbi:MAG: hypothetical protein QXL94_00375 [Candidatus Parvarchaeum sp.]